MTGNQKNLTVSIRAVIPAKAGIYERNGFSGFPLSRE
jgi:hypothetical protein